MTSFTLTDKKFDAFLFDMDGTIVNSIASGERVWTRWANKYGIDPVTFLPTVHGVKATETIGRLNLPGVDPVEEARILAIEEMEDLVDVKEIGGAFDFLQQLPADRWAIVTSAPLLLAQKRIEAAGLPFPNIIVSGQDVAHGKPSPDCFLLGARKLGFEAKDCLVFEDAPAGIIAGETSGAQVVVITETHAHPYETAHTRIANYHDVQLSVATDGRLQLSRRA